MPKIEIDTTYGHPRFFKAIEKMAVIHGNKNRDYGNGNPLGNFMTAEQLGVNPFLGVLVRMSDKWTRICSLVKSGEQHVKDESIEDTLLDLANYCLLALVIKAEVDGKKECPGHATCGCETCVGDLETEEIVIGEMDHPDCFLKDGACVSCDNCTCENEEFDDLIDLDIPNGKTLQCLHCTNKDTEVSIHTTCGHCVHRDMATSYGVDYFVDKRQVELLAGNGDDVDSKGYRCVGGEFCACEKCEKARFLNAM